MKKHLFIIVLFSIILISYFYGSTYQHEIAHQEIGKDFGCINSSIEMNFEGGVYRCYNYENGNTEVSIEEKYLQNMNEIVSYNLTGIGFLIWGLCLIMTIILYEK